jgi:hypothetical protein
MVACVHHPKHLYLGHNRNANERENQMAHYGHSKSRLHTRTKSLDTQWLRTCSEIGMVVNNWASRQDLAVYAGDDSAEGKAVAAFYSDIAEIEVSIAGAFGTATTPKMVGNFTQRTTQYEFPNATGVIYHEALHARFTAWDTKYLADLLDPNEQRAFMLLEESRIEKRGVIERPENRLFLRSSALHLALEEADPDTLATMGDVWQSAFVSALSLARYDAGVLDADDVAELYTSLTSILGMELYRELRKIWVEFQSLNVSQADKGADLAKKWVELLRQADPEGEPENGEGVMSEPSESESGDSESKSSKGSSAVSKIIESLEKSAVKTELNSSDELGDQEKQEKWQDEAKARQDQSKSNDQKRKATAKVFDKTTDPVGSGSSSRLLEKRSPTSNERASAVKIGQMLDKAKYRERSLHERKSVMPEGRLNSRVAVQNAALKAKGVHDTLPAWRKKVRKHTDDPTLRIGIMVDISGSMSSAMEAMATTAWIMGEAGHRIQAKTAMVYYGSGVFSTLRVGQRLADVSIYSAPDGTEKFDEAWQALDGEVRLTSTDGVRMLVIVSDGNYTKIQFQNAVDALTECKRNGVAVLIITPRGCMPSGARAIIQNAAWGVHLTDMDTKEIAMSVGQAATDALNRVGSQA